MDLSQPYFSTRNKKKSKKSLQYRCFPVNFAEFWKTIFLRTTPVAVSEDEHDETNLLHITSQHPDWTNVIFEWSVWRACSLVVSDLRSESKRFPVGVRLLAMCRSGLSAVIARPTSNCLWGGWKWYRGVKQMPFLFPCYHVNRKCSWKKTQIEKKKKYDSLWIILATHRNGHGVTFFCTWPKVKMT